MPSTHHEIAVTYKDDKKVVPATIPPLAVGDTVLYSYNGVGKLTLIFTEGSPYHTEKYANTEVPGDTRLTVMQEGEFPMGCQVVLPDKKMIGWIPGDATTKDSGGTHHVRKPL
jgi:hypothetical protein